MSEINSYQVDFERIVESAIKQSVSDIYIEVRSDIALVRFRRDRLLKTEEEWSIQYAREFFDVVYQVMNEGFLAVRQKPTHSCHFSENGC